MKPRHKRFILVVVALALLTLGAMFVLKAFRSNLVFFLHTDRGSCGTSATGSSLPDRGYGAGGQCRA